MCRSELTKKTPRMANSIREIVRILVLPVAVLAAGFLGGCVGTTQGSAGFTAAPEMALAHNPNSTIAAGIVPDRAPPVAIGDELGFRVSANGDAYGHLYLINASGRVFVLVENLRLPANAQIRFPRDSANLMFRAQPPAGVERVVLLATRHRFAGFSQGTAAGGPVQIAAEAREFVSELNAALGRLPEEDWTIAETHIEVIGQKGV